MADETTGATAVAEAPASTPAGTSPTPSSSPAPPAEKFSSFAEALTAKMAAPAPADPGAKTTPTEPAPVAATTPPQPTPPVAGETAPTDAQGPIPFDRHKAALDNARTKTEAEVTQRLQEQWAPHVRLGQEFQRDPVGTAIQAIAELSTHPQHGQAMVSALARALGSRRGQPPAQTATPDQDLAADLQTSDGTKVFSADRVAQLLSQQRDQLLHAVDQRLQPLQSREQQRIAQERHAEAWQASKEQMGKVLAPYKELPGFAEHKSAIGEKAKALMKEGHAAETALGLAVVQILLPRQAAQSREQLVQEAVAKATGSTSTPGAAPAAPAGRPRDFESAFKRIAV